MKIKASLKRNFISAKKCLSKDIRTKINYILDKMFTITI